MPDEKPGPGFTVDFAIDEIAADWISIRHRLEGHWWRFEVAEKNGRLQLVHAEHRLREGASREIGELAVDAYDTATLEARRRGMVD